MNSINIFEHTVIDFAQAKQAVNDRNKREACAKLKARAIKVSLEALMANIAEECADIVMELEDHDHDEMDFVEFFDEAIRHKLDKIMEYEDDLFNVSHRVDMLKETMEHLHLGGNGGDSF